MSDVGTMGIFYPRSRSLAPAQEQSFPPSFLVKAPNVGTIGTILSPIGVNVQVESIGTIGTVVIERFSSRVVLEQSASLIGGFTGTVDMANFRFD